MRYFYPARRAHHAYCMSIDFGMKFKKRDGFWTPEGLLHITGAGNYRIEVADESLHLLEPLQGDWIKADELTGGLVSDLSKENKEVVVYFDGYCLVPKFEEVEIIQRDGKPFHSPDVSDDA